MPTFYDGQNQPLALGERLGSGGEGTVYSCGDSTLVAKIYHEVITDDKAEKLVWMAAHKNEQLLKVAAWVVDVLRDAPDGKIVGFTMPNVKAKEIHELYSLKSRRVHFPEATWQFLVHTAGNVARAFHNLHKNAHIMGDVNHGNCVVLADGTVKLIDCDSYSVKTDARRYPCEVGVATHLAPELQGVNLGAVEREEKHDNFGLAVIIFQLLFLGRHPFAGNYLGAEDKSIEDCIREYLFAYSANAKSYHVAQPPGTLSLSAVSPAVAELFTRAFLTRDKRPEPQEWIEALSDLAENLEQCALHPGHFYYGELPQCPWCDLESRTGLMLFPFVTAGQPTEGEKPFNIFTVENLIASFGINENLAVKPPVLPSVLPPPPPEILEAKREITRLTVISITTQFFGLIFLMAAFGVGIGFFVGICAMIFWIIFLNDSSKKKREDYVADLSAAQAEWDAITQKHQKHALAPSLDADILNIRRKVTDYQNFQQERLRESKKLSEVLTQRELFRHLRTIKLADAEIEGFAEQEKQWLVGKGVQTAAEINENRIRGFHDFNGDIVPKLLEWRGKLEREYAAAAPRREFKDEREEFVRETARERRRIETEIEHSLTVLRSGAVNARRLQQELTAKVTDVSKRLLQSQSNAEAVGSSSPAIVVLVLITILTPYFGFIVSQINAPQRADDYSTVSGTGYGSGDVRPTISAEDDTLIGDSANLPVPDEKITDRQIADLSGAERTKYAGNLFSQATDLAYAGKPDYAAAERKMRLSIRLQTADASYLNRLGYILYAQGKYDESLKFLNQSLKIDEKNTGTQIYIANNYLKMKRFEEAQKILANVISQYPGSFEGNYNLGLAQMGLKNYQAAANALEEAAKVGKDDANTHYQLGICYYELGEVGKVQTEYIKLRGLDKQKADDLVSETGITPPKFKTISREMPPPPPPAPLTIRSR